MQKFITKTRSTQFFIILAALLLLINFTIGCSVKKNTTKRKIHENPQTEESTPQQIQELPAPQISQDLQIKHECTRSTQWNEFSCEFRWNTFAGQLFINQKTINGQLGRYTTPAEGGTIIVIHDQTKSELTSILVPIDILIDKDLTVKELNQILLTKNPINNLHFDGPVIITTEGQDLTLNANTISIYSTLTIQNFDPNSVALHHGREGGKISITAKQIVGNDLLIDPRGQNGGNGKDAKDLSKYRADDGKNGGYCHIEEPIQMGRFVPGLLPKCRCSQSVPYPNQGLYDIHYIAESLFPTSGKDGRHGISGGKGYNGGDSSEIEISAQVSELRSLSVVESTALGGAGGRGGRGEEGGRAGVMAAHSKCLPENYKTPVGGLAGSRGQDGEPGNPGFAAKLKINKPQ